ncbi:MAG: hypothetical protein LBT93_02460 [Treponema sp.]|jgi:hypothetical protein|nr:hypothetical protein [Treponema sp.]
MRRCFSLFGFLICTISILFCLSCDGIFGIKYGDFQNDKTNNSEENKDDYTGRETRQFYAYNFTEPYSDFSKNYYKLDAVHLAENNSCVIYGEQSAGISLNTAGEIAEEFRRHILEKISGAFGPIGIMPGNNKKFVLLLLDIRDGAQNIQTPYIAGYFDYRDLLARESYPYSNELGMIYLDVKPGEPGEREFYTTIAHELQHNINFIASVDYRRDAGRTVYLMDTWVDEGLSSAAEDIYLGDRLSSRINHFNRDPYGTIARGNNFFVWDNHEEDHSGAILDEYATVYLFFQWLRIHASNGIGIYKDIISSPFVPSTNNPLEFTGVGAIIRAVKTRFTASPSQGTQNEWNYWEVILREWLLANYLNHAADTLSPTLGYKGQISTFVQEIADPSIRLAPGEGVFSVIANQFVLWRDQTDVNIDYAGINRDGTIHTGSLLGQNKIFTGTRLLTFNKNYDNALYKYKIENSRYVLDSGGNRIVEQDASLFGTGYLTGVKPSAVRMEDSRQVYTEPSSFVIDAGDFLRNRRIPDRLGIGYGQN